jgi:hypothetical protein
MSAKAIRGAISGADGFLPHLGYCNAGFDVGAGPAMAAFDGITPVRPAEV